MADDHFKVGTSLASDPFRLTQPNDFMRLGRHTGDKKNELTRAIFERFPTLPAWVAYHPDLNPVDWRLRQLDLQNLLKSDPQMQGRRKDAPSEQAAATLVAYLELKRQAEISLQQEVAQKYEMFRQSLAAWRFRTMSAEILNLLLRLRERDRVAQKHSDAYADFELRRQIRQGVIKEGQELNLAVQDRMRGEQQAIADERAKRQAAGVDLVQNWAALSQSKLLELRALPATADPKALSASAERNKIVEVAGRSAYAAAAKQR